MADPISGVGAPSATNTLASAAASASNTDRLGKQDFLKLLVAQLRNQDPMKPMEDREFIAQLAQFSSLEALQNLEKKLDGNSANDVIGQAAALIGKHVEATLADGSHISGPVSEVRFASGTPHLIVQDKSVDMSQLTLIGGQEAGTSTATP